MGDTILGRLEDMDKRLGELENSVGDLMKEAGLEEEQSAASSSSVSRKNPA